ncbi:MAG: apolipoprotein N-acyltransferase [Planctomycetota bacterium]
MTQVPAPTALPPRAPWRTRGWFLVLGLAHSALLLLAFEPVNLWWLAFVALIPLLIAAGKGPISIPHALLLWVGAWPFMAIHHIFIADISAPGYVPMFLYLSMWSAAFVWLFSRCPARFPRIPSWIAVPVLWTSLEMLRAQVLFDGYGWFLLGQPLIRSTIAAAPGAFVGLFGVSFLVALVSAAAFTECRARTCTLSRASIPVLAGAGLWALANFMPIDDSGAHRIRVSVVQTNVPQSNKLNWSAETAVRDFDRLCELTTIAARDKPDLVVWPETMCPTWVLTDAQVQETRALLGRHPTLLGLNNYIAFGQIVRGLSEKLGLAILVGQETITGLEFVESAGDVTRTYAAKYNSAYLVDQGIVAAQRYDKLLLTPFGETIPYLRAWPWLRDQLLAFAARGMKVDLSTGTNPTVFRVNIPAGQIRVVTPICFEATDAQLCRYLVYGARALELGCGTRRADLLVGMTNDGWFGDWNPGRAHHLQLAQWRCLELGTPMARAANTGISAFIDARGRLLSPDATAPDHIPASTSGRDGVMTFDLRTINGPTMYGRLGNVVGWGSLAATGFGFGWLVLSALAGRPSTKPKGT